MPRLIALTILLAGAAAADLAAAARTAVETTPMSAVATRAAGWSLDLSSTPGGTVAIVVLTVFAVILIRKFGALE